jgi:spore coat protein H
MVTSGQQGEARAAETRWPGWLAAVACLLVGFLGCGRHEEAAPNSGQPSPEARPVARVGRIPPVSALPATRASEKRALQPPMTLSASQRDVLAANGTSWLQKTPPDCKLPFYQLRIDSQDLLKLERFPRLNDTYPALFVANAKVYEVTVRDRGDWARTWPKKSLKIFFDRENAFEGQHSLNLNSGWHDPAFVREPLAYHVYDACGVPAPHSRMVRLHVNGQFRGLYVEVEQPDKAFLKRHNWQGASVFKAASRSRQSDERNLGDEESYRQHYQRETRKTEGFAELQQFCQELDGTTNVVEFFSRQVEVEKYINYLAATVLVQNWDCYNKNHFLIHDDRGSRRWVVVPWDVDRTFGDYSRYGFDETRLPILHGTRQLPGTTGWNRLADRFLNEPALRARFLDRLTELIEREFTTEKLYPVLDRLEAEVRSEAALDRQRWGGGGDDIHSEIAQVKRYIVERRNYLLKEVAAMRKNSPAR